MTLGDLVKYVRYRLNNFEKPYLWTDSELVFYINDSIRTMCRDALILKDSTTASVCEIPTTINTLDYSLHSSIITVESVTLSQQEVLTLDVAPSTDWSIGNTITGISSGFTCKIVLKLTSLTYVIDSRTGSFTLGEALTNGTDIAALGNLYPQISDYSSSIIEKTTNKNINASYIGWRYAESSFPYLYLLDYNANYITVYPKPDKIYILKLSVYRYPLADLTTTDMDAQTPEIDAKYHNDIITGVCAQALTKRGEVTFDQKLSLQYLGLFRKSIADIKFRNMLSSSGEESFTPSNGFL